MITFKIVEETDTELNSKIEELNKTVFPWTVDTADLHFLTKQYEGATVDFIAVMDDDRFVGYTYMINFF